MRLADELEKLKPAKESLPEVAMRFPIWLASNLTFLSVVCVRVCFSGYYMLPGGKSRTIVANMLVIVFFH